MVRKRRLWILVTSAVLLGGVLGLLPFAQDARAAQTITVTSITDNPYETSMPTTFMRVNAGSTGNVAFCAQGTLHTPVRGTVLNHYGSLEIPQLDYVLYHGYDGEVVTSLYGMDAERSEAATSIAVWLAIADRRADVLTSHLANGNTVHGNRGYHDRWYYVTDSAVRKAAKRLSDEAEAYAKRGGGGPEAGCATYWSNPYPTYVNGKAYYEHQGLVTVMKQVTVDFAKTSARSEITTGNGNYSLAGAVYDIHRASDGEKVSTITMGADGTASLQLLPGTSYYAVEKQAPPGFALNPDRIPFETERGGGAIKLPDIPGTVTLKIRKKDAATGGEAQPGATLKGASFQVVSHSTAGWSASATTDEDGELTFTGIPLGDIEVFETAAPEGYKPLGTSLSYTVTADALAGGDTVTLEPADDYREHPIAFDIEITKFLKEDYEGSTVEKPGEGIRFEIISNTTDEVVGTIETDGDGRAVTSGRWFGAGERVDGIDGAMPYDREGYTVREVADSVPEGFGTVGSWVIGADQMANGTTLRYIVNNSKLSSYLQLVKTDAGSGRTVALPGFSFQVLDSERNPVTQHSWYPNPVDIDTFTTDGSGSVTLPQRLKAGTYYIRELKVEPPYLLAGEDIRFEIDPDDGELEPVTVICVPNEQVEGHATIIKTCADDGKELEGAEFDVIAQQDVISPDGTVHALKGAAVAHVKTDGEGRATAKGLRLGSGEASYAFVETVPPKGHALDTTPIPFTLTYQDAETEVVSAHTTAEDEPTTVKLDKVILGAEEPLAGAVFELWREGDDVDARDDESADNDADTKTDDGGETTRDRYTTDENGSITIRHLEPGTYLLREVEAPGGYLVDGETRTFTVDGSGLIDGKNSINLTVSDDYTKIEITKRDITDECEIPGAKLTIYDAEGNVVDSWTSTTEPHRIDALEPGTYTLEETMTPQTYDKTTSIEFTVEETGEIQAVAMYDEPIEITGEIDKRQEIADPTAPDMEPNGDGLNRAEVTVSDDGSYDYSLDFRSTSSTWVDEFTVEDTLEAVQVDMARLTGLTTPIAVGDHDGLMNVWFRVETVGRDVPAEEPATDANATLSDGHVNPWLTDESTRDALGDDGRVLPYAGWRLWERDVPTDEAVYLAADGLVLADDERIVGIRFEYGRVEKGFTTRMGEWDRDLLKDPHDDLDDIRPDHGETAEATEDGETVTLAPAIIHMRVTDAYTERFPLENRAEVHLFRNGGGDGLEDHDEDSVTQTVKSRIRELVQTGITGATALLVIGACVAAMAHVGTRRHG